MLICDSREPPVLQEPCDSVVRLPDHEGDFWIVVNGETIKVERKTITDLKNTTFAGRLPAQILGVDMLLVEWTWAPAKVNWSQAYDIANAVAMKRPVLFSSNHGHTIQILRRIESKVKKGVLGTLRVPQTVRRDDQDQRVPVLLSLGFSRPQAIALLDKFASIQGVIAANVDWDEVRGIGAKSADKVWERWTITEAQSP